MKSWRVYGVSIKKAKWNILSQISMGRELETIYKGSTENSVQMYTFYCFPAKNGGEKYKNAKEAKKQPKFAKTCCLDAKSIVTIFFLLCEFRNQFQ